MEKKGTRSSKREKSDGSKATKGRATPVLPVSLALLVSAGINFWVYQAYTAGPSNQAILAPVSSISYEHQNHIHGLGYDSQGARLYVATHNGLFIWQDGELFQLGKNRDDFMGFSLHPGNSQVVYTSGHPRGGGNMGVMKSEDGGLSFKSIFRGLKGETVDFHSMIINPANPKILYGWFQGKIYRSKDGGRSWALASAKGLPAQGLCFGAPCLSADSKDERVVYAGTPDGLFLSRDFGESWSSVNREQGAFAGVGVDPADGRRIFAFTERLGLASSSDGGKTWQSKNKGISVRGQEFIFAFAFDRKEPKRLFAATPDRVFRTLDVGENWGKIF